MSFWKKISPVTASKDFVGEWRRPTEHRWLALGLSVVFTGGLLFAFVQEGGVAAPARPVITYITTFAPDRTQEEIIASNIENQKRQDELAELLEKRAELRKDMYRQLGRATGLDVDAMEAELAEDSAAEVAAQQSSQEQSAE